MYLLWSVISAFSTAFYLVYQSGVLKTQPRLHANTMLLGMHLAAGITLLFILPFYTHSIPLPLAPAAYAYLFGNALLLILSRLLYMYAYRRTDVANVTIFSPLTPLFAIGVGHLILGETLRVQEVAGILLICASIYAMFLNRKEGDSLAVALLSPFKHILHSTPVLMGFLSTIPTAFAVALQKKALQYFDPVTFSISLLLLMAVLFAIVEACRRKSTPPIAIRWRWWLIPGVLLALSQVIFCYVVLVAPTAIALVLQRFGIIFQVLLAYFLLKEKAHIGQRLLCSVGAVAGFALLLAQTIVQSGRGV